MAVALLLLAALTVYLLAIAALLYAGSWHAAACWQGPPLSALLLCRTALTLPALTLPVPFAVAEAVGLCGAG